VQNLQAMKSPWGILHGGAALSMVKSIELLSRWQSTAHTLVPVYREHENSSS